MSQNANDCLSAESLAGPVGQAAMEEFVHRYLVPLEAARYKGYEQLVPELKPTPPVVSIDTENYMLRGVSPAPEPQQTPPAMRSNRSDVDVEMFVLRESASSLNGGGGGDAGVVPEPSPSYCARPISVHGFLCSCHPTCCCTCASLCSPDCHACYHNVCARFAYVQGCQKVPGAPPLKLENLVSTLFLFFLFFIFLCLEFFHRRDNDQLIRSSQGLKGLMLLSNRKRKEKALEVRALLLGCVDASRRRRRRLLPIPLRRRLAQSKYNEFGANLTLCVKRVNLIYL